MDIHNYQSIITEFESYAESYVKDGIITINNKESWHFNKESWHHLLFNESYYIVGSHQCSEWLKKHHIDPFNAVGTCVKYEKENFGEASKTYDNSETTVNMLVYILGEQWLSDEGEDFILEKLAEDWYKEKDTFEFEEIEVLEELIDNRTIDTDLIVNDFRDWVLKTHDEHIEFEYEEFQNLLTFKENYENLKH